MIEYLIRIYSDYGKEVWKVCLIMALMANVAAIIVLASAIYNSKRVNEQAHRGLKQEIQDSSLIILDQADRIDELERQIKRSNDTFCGLATFLKVPNLECDEQDN